MPTLIGDEAVFTFQNLNVQRGLLWEQEPTVSEGVQANWSSGPFSLAVSVNDGFYSKSLNWIDGSASYAFNGGADTLTAVAGGNLGHNPTNLPFATPVLNDGSIVNLIYTHSSGRGRSVPICNMSTRPPIRCMARSRARVRRAPLFW